MKLYSVDLSPYAARVRLQIYLKGIAAEIVPPPEGGLKSPDYLALNPMGKMPVLALDDGVCLPESETILEYLEDAHPTPSLRPASALALARARLVARVGEIYVMDAIRPLFAQMNPATRDAVAVETHLATLRKGLGFLDHYLTGDAFAVSAEPSIADCSIVPVLFWVGVVDGVFQAGGLIGAHPKLAAYWGRVQGQPAMARVLGELKRGFDAFRARA